MNDPTDQSAPDVPDFDLIRPVGSGGFGQVWLAINRTTRKLRAVKVIPLRGKGDRSNLPERPDQPSVGARCFAQIGPVPFSPQDDPAAREISSLVRLEANLRCQHPNLLHIHHVGKTARHLFYVMDPADDAAGGPASDRPDYRPATLQRRLEDANTAAQGGQSPTNLRSVPGGERVVFAERCGWRRENWDSPLAALGLAVRLQHARAQVPRRQTDRLRGRR